MTPRDAILQRVRANQPAAVEAPELPAAAHDTPAHARPEAELATLFAHALERMGGRVIERDFSVPLEQQLAALFPKAGVIASATHEVHGSRSLDEARADPRALEDVDVGVVRAAFGVAETGSVALSERELVVNAIGFLPQHLVVLLDPKTLINDLHQAYRERGFFAAGYSVLMTGPSATADIEGVLIRGAQGVRSFTVILCAE